MEDVYGNIYGMMGLYIYLLPAPDKMSFLVCCKIPVQGEKFPLYIIKYYEVKDLLPLPGIKEARPDVFPAIMYQFNPINAVEFKFEYEPGREFIEVQFPPEFKKFGNFLFITDLDGLYINEMDKAFTRESTLLEFVPLRHRITIYPQDWYNGGNWDFGYQWITRAVRNPSTGLIEVQGMRMNEQSLDASSRQLKYQL